MKSHTIQRAYLRHFVLPEAKDRLFDVFSKESKTWNRRSPKSTTVIDDYYAVPRSNGVLDNSVEDKLNRIETPGITGLRKLSQFVPLSSNERQDVARYLGILLTRTTRMRRDQAIANEVLSDPKNVINYIQRERERLEQHFPAEVIDDQLERIRKGETRIQLPNSWYLISLESSEKYAETIFYMNWVVEKSRPPHYFITSDNPAFVCRPARPDLPALVGLRRHDLGAELCLPLTPTRFFRASLGMIRQSVSYSTPSRILQLNRRVAKHATDLVIAPERTSHLDAVISNEADVFVTSFTPESLISEIT